MYTVWAELGQEERATDLLKELEGFGSVCLNDRESKVSGLWVLPHMVEVQDQERSLSLKFRERTVFYQFQFLWKPRNFESFSFHLFDL